MTKLYLDIDGVLVTAKNTHAAVESMQKADIRYLENKVEMLSADCNSESEP